jgi:hypothetical protein
MPLTLIYDASSSLESSPRSPSHLSLLYLRVLLWRVASPHPTTFPGPFLRLPSSSTLVGGVETNSQEQVTPEVRGTEAVELEAQWNSPPEVVSVPPTFVDEWRLRQSQLPPQPEAATIPQSPPESVLSSTSDLPLSSVMSL